MEAERARGGAHFGIVELGWNQIDGGNNLERAMHGRA
jgi:hypothetical protein